LTKHERKALKNLRKYKLNRRKRRRKRRRQASGSRDKIQSKEGCPLNAFEQAKAVLAAAARGEPLIVPEQNRKELADALRATREACLKGGDQMG